MLIQLSTGTILNTDNVATISSKATNNSKHPWSAYGPTGKFLAVLTQAEYDWLLLCSTSQASILQAVAISKNE